VDKYIDSYDDMYKYGNQYLGLTGDENILYNPLLTNEKYSDLIQMFTDNRVELKVKYGY
jgi:GTP cyclohydrolase III